MFNCTESEKTCRRQNLKANPAPKAKFCSNVPDTVTEHADIFEESRLVFFYSCCDCCNLDRIFLPTIPIEERNFGTIIFKCRNVNLV
ncbi:hypothetical protein TVAGG3_1028230 [Trichomonas vaginalis G3]|uniref:hypothetical protein n=1 Tax=Trichomonas vaginalis (strain ATCC PRA-98 / G3) TaxID=412133 RepID=UPI0021E5FED1|nr:hypothetical protein TVAGG3_1028230 [Trichomonas vaginalis G3]KAI5492660.1 hypothetical protein TVAGG3_1028230 [Trichomonas vaginalis G3]